MAYYIRGGIFHRLVGGYRAANISLRPSPAWNRAAIYLDHYREPIYVSSINKCHQFDMVYFHQQTSLVINNGIVYQDKAPFTYTLELHLVDEDWRQRAPFFEINEVVYRAVV